MHCRGGGNLPYTLRSNRQSFPASPVRCLELMDPVIPSPGSSNASAVPDMGWPRRRQLYVLGLAAGVLVVGVVLAWLMGRGFGHGHSPDAPPALSLIHI